MYLLIFRGYDGRKRSCKVMGIFFTKKQAKRARDGLIKYDQTLYPNWAVRPEQDKKCYKIEKHKLFKTKKHDDPFDQ